MEFTNFDGLKLPQIAQNIISLYDYVVLYMFQTVWWFHYNSHLRSSCIFLEKYFAHLEPSTNKDNRGSPLHCTRRWNWQAPIKLNNWIIIIIEVPGYHRPQAGPSSHKHNHYRNHNRNHQSQGDDNQTPGAGRHRPQAGPSSLQRLSWSSFRGFDSHSRRGWARELRPREQGTLV